MNLKKKAIIDCEPGTDDVPALLSAWIFPEYRGGIEIGMREVYGNE